MTFEEYYQQIGSPEDIESAKAMYNSLYGASEEKPAMPELTQEQWEAMGKAKGWGQASAQPTVQTGTPVTEQRSSTPPETSTAVQTPVQTTPAASSNSMLQRVRGIQKKTKYEDFENLVKQYGNDGEISRADRQAMRKELGLSRKQMRGIAKGLNGGDSSALNAYTKGLEKRSYIDNGKLIIEGEGENFDPNAFNTAYESAKYKGTDINSVANQYNQDVLNWRKNATITYDPTKNAYIASGFNNGEAIDVTNSDWFKNDIDRQRKAQLTAYREKVDAMDSAGLAQNYGNAWGTSGLAATLGLNQKDLDLFNGKVEGQTMSDEDKAAFKEKAAVALRQKLDGMRKNSEGGFDFNGSIQADQITKYLIEQQKNDPNAYSFLDTVSFAPGGRYASAGKTANAGGAFNLLKQGGSLKEKAKAFKKGGAIQYAGGGDALYGALDLIPIVGTLKQGYEMATSDKPVSGSDWASLGLSALGDALMFTGIGAGAGAALKGASTVTKAGIKSMATVNKLNKANKTLKAANAGAKTASKELAAAERAWLNAPHGAQKAAALTAKNEKAAALAAKNVEKTTAQASVNALERAKQIQAATRTRGLKEIGQGLKPTLKPGWRNPLTAGWKKTTLGAVVGQTGRNMGSVERAAWEEYKQQAGLMNEQPVEDTTPNVIPGSAGSGSSTTYTPDVTYSPYFSDQILIGGHKNGGILNMNKINYFQEGGAMAPQAAPAAAPTQGGQDIQAQVMQLVQAAMSGDQKATQAIQQIMQAAQQGDQQAMQIAQMIQEVTKQMQGQATAAKYGSKLSYLKSLRSGCPEGYEVSYHKKGGVLCKECVAKSHDAANQTINNTTESVANNYVVNRVNNAISGVQKQQAQDETTSIDIISLNKKGGCLKKKLSCGKKMQEGSKVDEAKCGTKVKAACGTKATMDKCGSKLKKKLSCGKKMQEGDKIDEAKCGSKMKASCGAKATMDKCGGKAKKKCLDGAKVVEDKCGGKAKKKCLNGEVLENKCGGKTKKKKCLNGGTLTLEALQTAYKSLYA